MGKKARAKNRAKGSSKRNTDGDDLIDDDAANVAVAEKPERTKKAETKKQDANQRKTGPAASKRDAAKAKKSASSRTTFDHKTPKAGTKFERVYKGQTLRMLVKASAKAESGVVYVFKGKQYATPTDAADVAIGVGKDRKTGTNGWFFWGISQRPSSK